MLKSDFDLCEEAESEILRLKKHLENQNKTKTIRWNPKFQRDSYSPRCRKRVECTAKGRPDGHLDIS